VIAGCCGQSIWQRQIKAPVPAASVSQRHLPASVGITMVSGGGSSHGNGALAPERFADTAVSM
jgi:hypothetical protein